MQKLGLPAVLKTTRLGYDGKGQAMLRAPEDARARLDILMPKPLVLEGFVDFAAEISVMVARGADGAITAFDTVENRHRHHILDLTLAPAPPAPNMLAEAGEIARLVAEKLELIGLLGVEMFVTADGRLLVNEIAPRPHNPGTGPSMPAQSASSRCISAPSPACPCRRQPGIPTP